MKHLYLKSTMIAAMLAASACATVPVMTAAKNGKLNIGPNVHPRLGVVHNQIQTTGDAYVSRAKRLQTNGQALSAITSLGAIGTVAVSAFDGGATAIAATAIGTQSFNIFQSNLKPTSRSQAYAKGANALGCISMHANSMNVVRGHDSAIRPVVLTASEVTALLTAPSLTPTPMVANKTGIGVPDFPHYKNLDVYLEALIDEGNKIPAPAQSLKDAIAHGDNARERLQTGIEAQDKLLTSTQDTFLQIVKAVEEATAVDIDALIKALSSIEISSAGDTPTPTTAAAGVRALAAPTREDAITALINLAVDKVNTIDPEKDADALMKLVSCSTVMASTQ